MKKNAFLMKQEIAKGMTLLGAPGGFPPLEEIDQVSGGVFFQYDEKAPEGERHRLLFSLSVLRTTREFNWKKLIDSIARKHTEIPVEGQACYKVLLKDFNKAEALCGVLGLLPIESDSQGERSICFLLPDKRTLIMGSENQFKELLAPEGKKPAWATTAAWHRAERGLFAVAIDNRDHSLAKAWGKADEKWMRAPSFKVVTEKAGSVVLGFDYDGEFKFDAFALCRNPSDSVAVANAALRFLVDQQPPWLKRLPTEVSVGMERASKSDQEPTVAHVHARVKADFAEFFQSLGDAKVEALPPESSP
jgi:hypothetical protein